MVGGGKFVVKVRRCARVCMQARIAGWCMRAYSLPHPPHHPPASPLRNLDGASWVLRRECRTKFAKMTSFMTRGGRYHALTSPCVRCLPTAVSPTAGARATGHDHHYHQHNHYHHCLHKHYNHHLPSSSNISRAHACTPHTSASGKSGGSGPTRTTLYRQWPKRAQNPAPYPTFLVLLTQKSEGLHTKE